MSEFVTHDVKRFVVERPEGYVLLPGQATDVSINKASLKWEERPFTFTSLKDDLVLEFTIKKYPEHKGITQRLHELRPGDELVIRNVWGTINYEGEGVFIAGGAGITPFIAILRQLKKDGAITGNKLIFSNKTERDVIMEKEFREMFGENAVFTLTREEKQGYESGRIDKAFLERHINDFNQHFYVCGSKKFVEDVNKSLKELGAKTDLIIFER